MQYVIIIQNTHSTPTASVSSELQLIQVEHQCFQFHFLVQLFSVK